MIMEGFNVNAGGELGAALRLSPEQLDIPPANAAIGGALYGPTITMLPLTSLVVEGITITGMVPYDVGGGRGLPTIYVSIAPILSNHDDDRNVDIKAAYEKLRQQMAAEGIPFLNAAELEREIADRKGTRS